ncbi:MAG: hypothetical protein KKA79_03800 [Nanoarchaeota archaeon]|nr:hypothetical protein [Nanoarchaeota archaeon]MCG2717876.1 hypothetical protein [Nanoarchaeota archaeon]
MQVPKEISVASGEMEIIEIKADKSYIVFSQKESYKAAVKKGYPLRYFHVNFISFENNQFEIQERLILKADEIDTLRSATKKS